MAYGLRIFDDATGQITLDISDDTVKEVGAYFNDNITANGTINSVGATANSIVAVVNKSTTPGAQAAAVALDIPNNRIVVSGGSGGFRMAARVMEV